MIYADAFADAKKHAREVFPEESCGFIVDGIYLRMPNIAADPATHEEGNSQCNCRLCRFEIPAQKYLTFADRIQMVVHSHPYGPAHPSMADMAAQVQMDVAWAILMLNEDLCNDPVIWGGDTPMEPIIGRQFVHGISDCYTLIRDVYALGKDGLAKQDISWPLPPILLPEFPRDDAWWNKDFDLYETGTFSVGFKEISMDEVRAGDAFQMKIRSDKYNHAGIVLSQDLILHHLPHRLSRREPSGIWARNAGRWVRYVGNDNA